MWQFYYLCFLFCYRCMCNILLKCEHDSWVGLITQTWITCSENNNNNNNKKQINRNLEVCEHKEHAVGNVLGSLNTSLKRNTQNIHCLGLTMILLCSLLCIGNFTLFCPTIFFEILKYYSSSQTTFIEDIFTFRRLRVNFLVQYKNVLSPTALTLPLGKFASFCCFNALNLSWTSDNVTTKDAVANFSWSI